MAMRNTLIHISWRFFLYAGIVLSVGVFLLAEFRADRPTSNAPAPAATQSMDKTPAPGADAQQNSGISGVTPSEGSDSEARQGGSESDSVAGSPVNNPVPAEEFNMGDPQMPGITLFAGNDRLGGPSAPQIEKRSDGCTVRLKIPGFAKIPQPEEGEDFVLLEIPGWSRMQDVGKPSAPFKTIMLEIPRGVTPKVSLRVLAQARVQPVLIAPAQPPLPDVFPEPPRPAFQKDSALYASDEPYPAARLIGYSVEKLRNRRILSIEVTPVQFHPASQTAVVAEDMELEIEYAPDGGDETGNAPADNGEELPNGFAEGSPGKYMILMDDQFTNNATLATFVDWKKRKGYDVTIVKTSDIDPSGGPTNGQIVAYMRALAPGDYPEYLLIIGDHTPTNGVEGTYFTTGDGGWTDLYIACRDGADYLPDLYYGRLPAVNNTHLTTMLTKVMLMDRTPPAGDFYEKVCIAGQLQDKDDTNNVADRLFCETSDLVACYFEQDTGGIDYECARAMVNPSGVTSNAFWNPNSILWNADDRIGERVWQHFTDSLTAKNRIIGNINGGIALVQHRDHGYSGGYGWVDPRFINSNVAALTNGVRLPAVFSINCCSGAYHQDRFLRAWFQNVSGGAYAVLAPVDVSYSWYNDWLVHGLYTAFLSDYVTFQNTCADPAWSRPLPAPGGAYGAAGGAKRFGEMLNFGKLYMREHFASHLTTFRLFHVFGDPESHIRLLTPAAQTVEHPAAINVGPATIVVSNLQAGAQVCLYSEALGVHMATNAPADTVSFDVNLINTGTVYVTSTMYGAHPYEGSIEAGGSVLEFDVDQYEVDEAMGSAWITVLRSCDTNSEVTVDYTTVAGSAEAGTDYTATNGTLAFAAGVVSNGFAVFINDEGDPEDYEFFGVGLSNPSAGAGAGARSNAVIRIEDNDSPGQFRLSSDAYPVGEGEPAVVISVLRANGAAGVASVSYAVSSGTAEAGADFAATSGVLVFAEGVVSNSFSIQILPDVQDEADETALIALSNPTGGAVLASPSNAVLTILDDDTAGSLAWSSAAYAVSETDSLLHVWVCRTGGGDGVVCVDFATSDGTAAAGSDYCATNGTLTLAHGVASNSIAIYIMNVPDGYTNETFGIVLSNPGGGASLGAPAGATVTIWDEALLLNEGFEGHALPAGWTSEYVVDTADWHYQTGGGMGGANPATAHGGAYNACLFALSATDHKTVLITPAIDFGPYTEAQLTFWHCMKEWPPNQDELRVYYRTSAGGPWTLLAEYTANVPAWTLRTVSLPNLSSSYYLAFEGNAKRGNGVCLDDIQVMGTSTAVPPSPDLEPPSVPAGLTLAECTVERAVITWAPSTDNVGVTGYRVYRNGVLAGSAGLCCFTNTGLTPGAWHTNRVSAYDAAGNTSALSAALVFQTPRPPGIVAHPQSRTNTVGSAAAFSVSAEGTAPLRYQWRKNGLAIAGATNAVHEIVRVLESDAGNYLCTVANDYGSANSDSAALTVTAEEQPLEAPAAVSASDGVYTDKVRVTWSASAGATGYELWRNTTAGSATATRLASPAGTAYDDTGAATGTVYYYWVKASAGGRTSPFSLPDTGYRASVEAESYHPDNDYDGDGISDLAVFDYITGKWYVQSVAGEVIVWGTSWGWPGALPVPGDYDGDGCGDLAVFDSNTGFWYVASLDAACRVSRVECREGISIQSSVSGIRNQTANVANKSESALNTEHWTLNTDAPRVLAWAVPWGWPGAAPVPGDYDGDGCSDLAVFDSNTGLWYVASLDAACRVSRVECREKPSPITDNRTPKTDTLRVLAWAVPWGWPGAISVPGDYDGDGCSDLAVFDSNTGLWYVASLSSKFKVQGSRLNGETPTQTLNFELETLNYSAAAESPITDNRTPKTDTLRVLVWAVPWGWPGAVPVPGDYNGDRVSDLAVFDSNTGFWYIAALSSKFTVQGSRLEDEFPITDNRQPKTDTLRVLVWAVPWGWPGATPPGGRW